MRLLVITCCTLLLAAGAAAQVDADPDGVGLYFDTGATVWCAEAAATNAVTTWLCLTRPSSPGGVGGFEVTVDADGPIFMNAEFPTPEAHLLSPPEFMVGFNSPLPGANVVILAELTWFTLDTNRVEFFVSPNDTPSIEGAACYADGADPRLLVPMNPSSGSWDLPVAVLNGECDIVPAETTSWGAIKTMYSTDEGEVVR